MMAQTLGCSMLAVNQHDHIFHFQAVFFQQRCCFEDATSPGDEVVNDERGVTGCETAFYATFASAYWPTAGVNKRDVRFQ